MSLPELNVPVPHSVGLNRPSQLVPSLACDSHMHIFDPRFASSPHWQRIPPVAPVAVYRQLQSRLGTTRTVVVTPSTYGTNNACTLDALDQMGDGARGVAVVGHDVSTEELGRLAARRVCGLRVNFVSPQSWGTTTPEMLLTLASKLAEHPSCQGWHVQVFAHSEQIVALAPQLQALPVPLVIDHMGRIDAVPGVDGDCFRVVRRLLDSGRTWVKLSGAYMHSVVGAQGRYADRNAVGQALIRAAPERMVWGSDWPHTTEPPESVNDVDLLDLLRAWSPSDETFERVLVANPAELYGFQKSP